MKLLFAACCLFCLTSCCVIPWVHDTDPTYGHDDWVTPNEYINRRLGV